MTSDIDAHRTTFGVEPICQALAIAPSTYYADRSRPPSARAIRDEALKVEIGRVHAGNFAVYGARKVWHQLRRDEVEVGRDRVGRLMDELGLCGATRTKRTRTTFPARVAERPADLVDRVFTASAPDRLTGGRPHLCLDEGRLLLRGLRHRCLQPPHRGLAGLVIHAHRPRSRRPRDGHLLPR